MGRWRGDDDNPRRRRIAVNKVWKIVAGLLGLVFLLLVGLAVFIRFYVTDERVKAAVVPQMEKALGREVTLNEVKIGLLKGVTVRGLVVKEEDGKADFATVDTLADGVALKMRPATAGQPIP